MTSRQADLSGIIDLTADEGSSRTNIRESSWDSSRTLAAGRDITIDGCGSSESSLASPSATFFRSPSDISNSLSNSSTPSKRQRFDRIETPLAPNVVDSVDLLEEEDDENPYKAVRNLYPLLSQKTSGSQLNTSTNFDTVDLTEDDDRESARALEDESRFDSLVHTVNIIDLEADDAAIDIKPDETILNGTVRIGRVNCAAGKAVEFADESFMRITSVLRNENGKLFLVGKIFRRQDVFGAKAPKRRNEVVLVGDARREVGCDDLRRNRQLILTNRHYPEVSSKTHPDSWPAREQDLVLGPLFCRLKRSTKVTGIRLEYECWEYLNEKEADPGYETRISNGAKRFAYRRCETMAGGAFTEIRPVVNLDTDTVENLPIAPRYTFGDAFCGAGGMSCGAQMAGLKLVWSFDHDPVAAATYSLNFPETSCYRMPVHEFVPMARQDYSFHRVDILHISPPCQPWSPAHTVASNRDEDNQAALLSVQELITSVKPRIVTIEETEGLVSRHGEWFAALIHIFIGIGYSVRWKIIKCGDYGIPQPSRRRLMIIASGPGENLPDFPDATHATAQTGALKKIPSIGDRIRNLEGLPNHDVEAASQTDRRTPFSPEKYAYTITCNSGVGNYHPSGMRNYTIRELACLQTFPRYFRFADVGVTNQRRQIGNAVPPELAKAMLQQIIKSLKRSDGLLRSSPKLEHSI